MFVNWNEGARHSFAAFIGCCPMELTKPKALSFSLDRTTSIWIVSAAIGATFMASTLVTPLYVIYEARFDFSRIVLTLIYAVYIIGNLIALLSLGRLSDVIGRRIVSLAAILLAGASALVFLFAASTACLFAARAVSGLSVGLAVGAGTAWMTELDPKRSRARASLLATSGNFCGLTVGALLSGTLAQFIAFPLELPFLVYLALLLALGVLINSIEETVPNRRPLAEVDWRPRIALPRSLRVDFIAPAITVFGAMAMIGYYAALLPSILADNLGETSHFIAGGVVAILTTIVAITIPSSRRLASRPAMLSGLALMLPSLALIALAQANSSMPALLAGTVVGGISTALGYRGSLQLINEIAPADRRAEVLSLYFLAGFAGNGLPVIAVGILSTIWTPLAAGLVFAACIGLFSLLALVIAGRNLRRGAMA